MDLFPGGKPAFYLFSILRPSMRTFLIKLFLATFLPAILITGFWWKFEGDIKIRADRGYNHSLDRALKIAKLLQTYPDSEVVFAGDSHAYSQLDPNIFRAEGISAVNVAMPGSDLLGFVSVMEELEMNLKKRIFVISMSQTQIDDDSLDTFSPEQYHALTPSERIAIFRADWFRYAWSLGKDMNWTPDSFRRGILAATLLPLEMPSFGFEPVVNKTSVTCNVRWPSQARTAKLNGSRFRIVRQALDRLAQWPALTYIYNPPLHPSYRDCTANSQAVAAEEQFAKLMNLAVAEKERIRFVDLSQLPAAALPAELYSDERQLTADGARIFTQYWLDEIRKSGWLPQRTPSSN